MRDRRRGIALALWSALALAAGAVSAQPDLEGLRALALAGDSAAIRPLGPVVLPELVRLYETTPAPRDRASIAAVFYGLGWKSPEAKRALMADVHTDDPMLRLNVQWALGRVSDDADVVEVLLENMRRDPVPLFRDKAACALAYDQIHLAPAQKLRLFEGLIEALGDDEPQVRQIALQALQILTGQTKGYQPNAEPDQRGIAIRAWERWLVDYRSQS